MLCYALVMDISDSNPLSALLGLFSSSPPWEIIHLVSEVSDAHAWTLCAPISSLAALPCGSGGRDHADVTVYSPVSTLAHHAV